MYVFIQFCQTACQTARALCLPVAPPPCALGASRVTAVCPCGPSVLLGLPGGARAS